MAKREAVTKPTRGEYKGHPTLTLPKGSGDFSFGLSKAKAILTYRDHIETFVAENDPEWEYGPVE